VGSHPLSIDAGGESFHQLQHECQHLLPLISHGKSHQSTQDNAAQGLMNTGLGVAQAGMGQYRWGHVIDDWLVGLRHKR
jgi:hypothetical protein